MAEMERLYRLEERKEVELKVGDRVIAGHKWPGTIIGTCVTTKGETLFIMEDDKPNEKTIHPYRRNELRKVE